MPTNAIRLYITYEKLFLAEFRALIGDIERAYNRVDSAAADTQRVRRRRRLTGEVFKTGQSIETILIGSTLGLLLLRRVLTDAIKLKHDYYGAEEQKWKAHEQKSKAKEAEQRLLTTGKESPAEHDEIDKLLLGLRDDPRLHQAEEILEKRITRIEKSRTITSISINVGDASALQSRRETQG